MIVTLVYDITDRFIGDCLLVQHTFSQNKSTTNVQLH